MVKKSNELTQANFSEFELSAYRVFLMIIAKMQQHNVFTGDLITVPLANRECRLTAAEYAQEFNVDVSNAYQILKLAVDKLFKTEFKMIRYTDKNVKYLSKINVCSKADYFVSQGHIDIKFTEDIMPHLSEVSQQFTIYQLADIAGFKSIYTTRLYEMLMQFKTTGQLSISLDKLRFSLGCVDVFLQYGHLKSKVINHAVKEINSKFDMKLTFTEVKIGKAVSGIDFMFLAVTHDQLYDVVKQKYRTKVGKHKRISQRPFKQTQQQLDIGEN